MVGIVGVSAASIVPSTHFNAGPLLMASASMLVYDGEFGGKGGGWGGGFSVG